MRHKGFTLVELMVVISVIALLSAILLPVTASVRGYARRTHCLSNLGQLGKAINLYVDDNENWYPCATIMPSTEPEGGLPRICDLLATYAAPAVFQCPDDRPTDPEYPFPSYFVGEGSSYQWVELFNHHKVGDRVRLHWMNLDQVPMMYDYEPFHRRSGKAGINGLFRDGHVESL